MTPWTSDTIWGHMMWAIRYREGQEVFDKVLRDFNDIKQVPWIISDAFPQGKLPIIRIGRSYQQTPASKKEAILQEQVTRILDEIRLIDVDLFEQMREGLSLHTIYQEVMSVKRCPITLKTPKRKLTNIEQVLNQMALYRASLEKNYCTQQTVVKNSINRLTGTTGEEGALYTQVEYTYHTPLEVYIKIREDIDVKLIEQALEYIEQTGYGKKASTGKGHIKTLSFQMEDKLFRRAYEGDAFVTIASYIPNKGDYTDVLWGESHYKQGKVSSGLGEANVFKSPFRYYQAGSVFSGTPNDQKGKMLKGLHENTHIVQCGIPFMVGVKS